MKRQTSTGSASAAVSPAGYTEVPADGVGVAEPLELGGALRTLRVKGNFTAPRIAALRDSRLSSSIPTVSQRERAEADRRWPAESPCKEDAGGTRRDESILAQEALGNIFRQCALPADRAP